MSDENPVLRPVLNSAETLRHHVMKKVVNTVESVFPIEMKTKTLTLTDVQPLHKEFSPEEQKRALMTGGSLAIPVKGTLTLKDLDGKVLDEAKNFTLMHVPYFTERHTLILDGNEYQVANMLRRKPGVYTQRSANGELTTLFNLSKGKNFYVGMNPEKGTFHLEYGTSKIPLYPVLRALGVPHVDFAKYVGSGVADQNKSFHGAHIESATDKLYKKIVHPALIKPTATHEEKVKAIQGKFDQTAMDGSVSKQTLGTAHDKVTPLALLEATKRLLNTHEGKQDIDDADSLGFKTFHSVDDFFAERMKLFSRTWLPKAKMRFQGRDKIREAITPQPFTDTLKRFVTTSTLAAVPTGINPIELLDHAVKVTTLGEGGIASERAIPYETRMLHPTQYGVIDLIRTPECVEKSTEIYTKNGWKFAPDLTADDELACLIDGALEFHKPTHLTASHYKGKMYGVNTGKTSYLVTPNHRVYYAQTWKVYPKKAWDLSDWQIARADEIHGKNRVFNTAHKPYVGSNIEYFELPKVESRFLNQYPEHGGHLHNSLINVDKVKMDDWASFMGWFLSEGSFQYLEESPQRGTYVTRISQSSTANPEKCEVIQALLERMPFGWSYSGHDFSVRGKQLASYVRQFGFCYDKYIPEYFFETSITSRTNLLESLMLGDGRIDSHRSTGKSYKQEVFCTTSPQLALDVERLAISLGRAVRTRKYQDKREERYLDIYEVRLMQNDLRQAVPGRGHYFTEDYDDMVYCPTVPGGLIYIRREGLVPLWSGNSSHAGVDLRATIAAHRDEEGHLYTPVYDVKKKIDTYIQAGDINQRIIAFPHQKLEGEVDAFVKGNVAKVQASDVQYQFKHYAQTLSPATSLVPFLHSTQGNRSIMGAKMQTQSLPLLEREAPYVQVKSHSSDKSYEHIYGHTILPTAPIDGTVEKIEGGWIHIRPHGSVKKAEDRPTKFKKKLGPHTFHIEIPKGVQHYSPSAKVHMTTSADYGYLPGYKGPDGDSLDFFVGEHDDGVIACYDKQKNLDGKGWKTTDTKFCVGMRPDDHKTWLNHPSMNKNPAIRFANERKFKDWDALQEHIDERFATTKTAAAGDEGLVKVPYQDNFPFPSKTYLHHSLEVKPGDKVTKGQRLADSNFTRDGVLALGKNLRVAYMAWHGLNSNDAVIISESCARKLTSEHVYREVYPITHKVELNKNKHHVYYGAQYTPQQYAALDEHGIVKVGAKVNQHDLLVAGLSKSEISGTDLMLGRISKALTKPYREVALHWEHGTPGTVSEVVKTSTQIAILVKTQEPMQIGDKLCYDEETEVLTTSGWKFFSDVSLDDKVATLQNDCLVFDYPSAKHTYPTGGRMYKLTSQQVDLFVTEDHRMYVQPRDSEEFVIRSAKEIAGKRVRYRKDAAWCGETPDIVILPELEVTAGQFGNGVRSLPEVRINPQTYAMLLGAYISEGNLVDQPSSGSYGIDITQIKEPNRAQLLTALDAAGISYSCHGAGTKVRIYSKQLLEHLRPLGKSHEKYIPDFVLSWDKADLTILFNWLMWGDGHSKNGRPICYYTTSKRLADDVQHLAVKLGKAANITSRHIPVQTIKGKIYACRERYDVHIISTKLRPMVNHGHAKTQNGQQEAWVENYDRPVFCLTVPGGLLYVRRNGKPVISGNCGRYGNKGVVAEIVPDAKMVRDEGGNTIDVIMTSAGVVSRINPGQIIETAVGKVAHKTGKPIIYDNAAGHDTVQWAKDMLKEHKIKDKEILWDPTRNRSIKGGDGKGVFVGHQFIFKLFKSTETNFAAHGVGPYDINEQPSKKGGEESPKGLAKMEFDALVAHDVRNILHEASTIRSQKNEEFWKALQLGQPLPTSKPAFVFNKFTALLEGAGVKMHKEGSKIKLLPKTDKDILSMSSGAILNSKTVSAKNMQPETGGLFDPIMTGGAQGTKYSHIPLFEPMPNPVFEEPMRRLLGLTQNEFQDKLKSGGGAYFKKELTKIDIPSRLTKLREDMKKASGATLNDLVKQVKALQALQSQGLSPQDAYVISHTPVVPPMFRPILPMPNDPKQLMVADANKLYAHLIDANVVLKNTVLESDRPKHREHLYNAVGALFGTHEVADDELRGQKVKGFLTAISGQGSPKGGFFQRKIMRRTQDVSGRGTAVPDVNLNMDQVGLPEDMLWQMYDRFIIARLVRTGYPALLARDMVTKRHPAARDSLLQECKERPVYINRAPTLHRYSIVSAFPQPVQGKTIRVNPFIEQGMNLDYDGDALQVHAPVTAGGISDSHKMLLSNQLMSDQTRDKLIAYPQHEAILGVIHASQSEAGKSTKNHTFDTHQDLVAAWRKGTVGLNDNVTIKTPMTKKAALEDIRESLKESLPDFPFHEMVLGPLDN